MRKILGAAFVSLDGVIQAPGGPSEDPTGGFAHGGWLAPMFDDEVGAAIGEFFGGDYDLLLGRRTYDIFAAYWPYAEGENAPMGEAFTRATKYVLTRGDASLDWANSHRVGGVDALATIKAGDGPDMLIQGSSTLYPALLAAGLIDRLMLMTFPAVLGTGKRLFGDGTPALALRAVAQQVTSSGVTIVTYEPAGGIVSGWAGPRIDNEREQARQARMAEGSW